MIRPEPKPSLDALSDRILREIAAGLGHLSRPDDAPAELIKLGAVLALRMNGPAETIEGLHRILRQIAEEFPEEWRQFVAGQRLALSPAMGRA